MEAMMGYRVLGWPITATSADLTTNGGFRFRTHEMVPTWLNFKF